MDVLGGTRVVGIFSPASLDADLSDLIQEGVALREDGAAIVDLDTLPGGRFAEADEDTVALLVRGLAELGTTVSVTTTDARIAEIAIDHGARWVIDPSGTAADPTMIGVAERGAGAGWAIGPWSARGVAEWYGDEGRVDAYTDGLVRNLAALLDAGVTSDRIVLHAGAGLSADDAETWRMLNHLDRIAGIGYPVLVGADDAVLDAMISDDSVERLGDAAVGLAVLAAGVGAWGIRARGVARVAGALQRFLEPAATAHAERFTG